MHQSRKFWFQAAGWLAAFLLLSSLRDSSFFDGPKFEVIFAGCLALLGFLVLAPCAFGRRQQLPENAEAMGASNSWVSRITCALILAAVLTGFIAVMLRDEMVDARLRLGVVLSVLGLGIFSLPRPRAKARQQSI